MYESVRNAVSGDLKPGQNPPLSKKILAAFLTGCFSICFANPCDVAKVRMQAIARELGPGGQVPRATTIYKTIYTNEGISGFYRGI
jgi:Mitochondrial carrier protein